LKNADHQDKSIRLPMTILLLALALIAFAGNSLLNRAALADDAMDWASFTILRICSGAIFLGLLLGLRNGRKIWPSGASWRGSVTLFVYGGAFSSAYISLDAGMGALILFAMVQLTMQAIAIYHGIRPAWAHWAGLMLAFTGLLILLAPGVSAPPLWGGLLMMLAGISWGLYSWIGRGAQQPALATAQNFVGAAVLCVFLLPFVFLSHSISAHGVILALLAGTITSGLGYIIWYRVLPHLTVSVAAVAQLSVPAIAALGGILFLGEVLTDRFLWGSGLIFAGIAITIFRK